MEIKDMKNRAHTLGEYLFISIFVTLYIFVLRIMTISLVPGHPNFELEMDHTHYIEMSQNPLSPATAPFAYRILTPYIAFLLPFDITTSFQVITYSALFLTGIFLYSMFKAKFGAILGFTGVTFFYSLTFAARFLIFDFWLPDALAYLFTVLCFWGLEKHKYNLYSLFLTIGVMCKETVLFTIPVFLYVFLFEEKESKQKIVELFRYLIPSIVLFVSLRILVPIIPESDYDIFQLIQTVGLERLLTIPDYFYKYTVNTWGLILLVFPILAGREEILNWSRKYGVFILLVYSQLLLAINTERLLVFGFFPVLLIALHGMKRFTEGIPFVEIWLALAAFGYFFLRLTLTAPFDENDPFLIHVAAVLLTFTLVFVSKLVLKQPSKHAMTNDEIL